MKEYLYSYNFCTDENSIWIIDFIFRGLIRIDIENYKIECILSPMELYKYGYFDICKLIDWNDYIVIIPVKINDNWVIYDKRKKEIQYIFPISVEFCCNDAVRIRNKVFCFPLNSSGPIAIVNLDVKKSIKLIYNQNLKAKDLPSNGEVWTTVRTGDIIYFPIRGTDFIGITDGYKIEMLKMNLNNFIGAADFCGDYWWIVTIDGEFLYCINMKGEILESIPINGEFDCVRLIATDNLLFMIPSKGVNIYVFDIKIKKITKMNAGVSKLKHVLPEQMRTAPYWHYICTKENIIFLPHEYPCTIINLNTQQITHREIVYSEKFVRSFYWEYYRYVCKLCDKELFYENRNDSIEGYISILVNIKEDNLLAGSEIGKVIWEKCSGILGF